MSEADVANPHAVRWTPPFWSIPVAAIGLVTLLFAAPRPVSVATGILILVVTFAFLLLRWTAITIAMMPVLIIPPQFAKVYSYEVLIFVCAVGLAMIRSEERRVGKEFA